MIEWIEQWNLSYLCVFLLILTSIEYAGVSKLRKVNITLHDFSVAETKPLRGLMALLIIVTHVSFKYPNNDLVMLFTSFGAPVVSVFFFLSGYGLTVSLIRKGNGYLNGFLGRSLKKLLVPFLIASAIWIPLSYIFFDGSISKMMIGFITFDPPLPYSWFVYALILLYIFFYVVSKIAKNIKISAVIQVITTLGMVITFRMLDFGVYWYISLFAFNAGNIYAIFRNKVNHALTLYPIITLGTVLLVLVVMYMFHIRTGLLSVIPFGIVVSILVMGGGAKSRIMNFLGNISYEIYLMHGIAITLLDNRGLDWGMYLLLACIITVSSAYLLHIGCKYNYKPCIKRFYK